MRRTPHKFRTIEKELPGGSIPTELATRIRETAARRRTSISYELSLAVARGLDVDPAEFGIETVPT